MSFSKFPISSGPTLPPVPQELAPVLKELGVSTPQELGYDRPELALPNPYNIH